MDEAQIPCQMKDPTSVHRYIHVPKLENSIDIAFMRLLGSFKQHSNRALSSPPG